MVGANVYDVAAGAPKHLPVSPHSEQVLDCRGLHRGLPFSIEGCFNLYTLSKFGGFSMAMLDYVSLP